jgi:hypothetical protein
MSEKLTISEIARELRDDYPAVDVTTVVLSRDFAGVGCCVIPQDRVLAIIAALEAASGPQTPQVTDCMIGAALAAQEIDRIQGFSYEKRHVIRDVWLHPDKQEIWSAPVAGPDEYQAFQKQCRIEEMRMILTVAFAASPISRPHQLPDAE